MMSRQKRIIFSLGQRPWILMPSLYVLDTTHNPSVKRISTKRKKSASADGLWSTTPDVSAVCVGHAL